MLKLKVRYVFISSLFIIASCKHSDKSYLPISIGKPGSLVIVSDDATQNSLKNTFDSLFLNPINDTSATELFYEILRPNIVDFTKLFFNQNTILVLVTEDNYNKFEDLLSPFSDETIHQLINDPQSKFLSKSDIFAQPQHLVYIFGKNSMELQSKLNANRTAIINALQNFELMDQSKSIYMDTTNNTQYYTTLKEKYGVGIRIPATFKLNQALDNFYWFQMEAKEEGTTKILGLIIHAYPFKDSSSFNYINIRSMRDTICKHHILGEIPGTYMSTSESDFYPARSKAMIQLNGYTTCKIKGWWTIKGISMAGPFVRYVVHVPKKNIIFAFEGYIYSPDLKRRDRDLRLIEAMALSIK